MKEVILQNGVVINYGPWDYRYTNVQTGEDGDGNPVFQEIATNPLPEGAVSEQWDMEWDNDIGWYKVGEKPAIPLTPEEDMRRTVTDLYKLLVNKKIITTTEVPVYNEYDYRAALQKPVDNARI